jgi:polar amino acid transport system substrate-binding protein
MVNFPELPRHRFLILCLFALLGSVHAEEHLSVTLASTDYPPLIGQKLPYGGMLTRIVVEAFRKEEVDVKLIEVPNNRAITGVMIGLLDGSYGWAHNPERDKKLLYSHHPIFDYRMVFFQRRGEEHPWKHLADLGALRIGVTLGNFYSDEFASLQAAGVLHVEEAETELSSMRKLLAGRIDLFPMEEEAGQFIVIGNFSPEQQAKISFQSEALSTVPTFVVIRRDLPHATELIERFDRGYQQLKNDGELDRLFDETRTAVRKAYLLPENGQIKR